MVEGKMIGAVGIIALLLGVGGTTLLTQQQYDSSYICDSTTLRAMFLTKVSSTGKTGYYLDGNITKTASCSTGWIKLDTYAKNKGIPTEQLLQSNLNRQAEAPLVITCDTGRCYCNMQE